VLPFSLPGFIIDTVDTRDGKLLVEATAVRSTVACPDCYQFSARIHSWYMRTPRDLPVSDHHVQLLLHVRRFFCDTPSCPRRTFAERLPDLVPFHAQRTQRFSRSLEVLGFALGGRAAVRVASKLRFKTSRNTLLRIVQHAELPPHPVPRVLGVDDVAFRKGHTYGTILVDLEQHRPVDLLPDRDAELLATWLQAHPGVEIVSRDRSPEYARGIRSGAPDAIQVADRFHLLLNLREALERVLDRRYSQLRASVVMPSSRSSDTLLDTAPVLRRRQRSTQDEAARTARRERRLARYQEVITRYEQGASMREIADAMHLSRWQVQRFVKASTFPEQAPRRRRARILIPFTAVLEEQWAAGERNAMAIWRSLQQQGYTGSAQTIRRWVQARRQEPAPRTRPEYRATYTVAPEAVPRQAAAAQPLPAPRQLVWLLIGDMEKLNAEETHILEQLRKEPIVEQAYTLGQQFLQIVRQRQHDAFDGWLAACQTSGIPDLQGFAAGLKQDEAAVRAALRLEWSNGQVEGQNTRLKMLKRQMYGRAGFALLRKRILHAA
jgi:transposase